MGIASFEKYAFSGGAGKCDDVFGEAPVADTICTGPLLLQSFALARIPKSARGNKTSGGSTATRNIIATQLLNA